MQFPRPEGSEDLDPLLEIVYRTTFCSLKFQQYGVVESRWTATPSPDLKPNKHGYWVDCGGSEGQTDPCQIPPAVCELTELYLYSRPRSFPFCCMDGQLQQATAYSYSTSWILNVTHVQHVVEKSSAWQPLRTEEAVPSVCSSDYRVIVWNTQY